MLLNRKQIILIASLYFNPFLFSQQTMLENDLCIKSIYELLPKNAEFQYIKCQDQYSFEYESLPISNSLEIAPNKGILAETFILKIPNGTVFGKGDYIKINNSIIEETAPPFFNRFHERVIMDALRYKNNFVKIKGKVATISANYYTMYGHWLYNCLGRLALLEVNNIDYDYLYVPYGRKYIKETLILWGIDESKIIEQQNINEWMQADELIVTSFIGNRSPSKNQITLPCIPIDLYCNLWNLQPFHIPLNDYLPSDKEYILNSNIDLTNVFMKWAPLCALYPDKFVTNYIHQKFISKLPGKLNSKFSKKIFISRKDTGYRLCLNEDEIFAIFQKYGYERYCLSQLSMEENIELFHNAESVAGLSGSGMTQILFCKPNTEIIEIFMDFAESCFCYLSQELALKYHSLKTKEISFFGLFNNAIIDPQIITDFLKTHYTV